jgi:hypothetical protein
MLAALSQPQKDAKRKKDSMLGHTTAMEVPMPKNPHLLCFLRFFAANELA